VPSLRRRASVIDADRVDEPPQDPDRSTDAAEALALAEEADAEAAEAEAIAAAARARARAIRLRRQAQAAGVDAAREVQDRAADVATETTDVDVESPVADAETEASDVVAEPVDASEVDEAEEASDDLSAPAGRRGGLVLKVVAMTLASLLTVALLGASGYMVWQHRNVVNEQRMNAEYAAAARQSAVTLMSLDFNKAKEDVQRIIDNSTGQFRDDFKNQAEDFIKVAQDSKVITEVTVNATGVESMTDDSAVVLVSATSRVTNAAGAKQEPRSWRLSVNLQREGDQIKMSKVEFVP
jgi:Mce-associated membrane protein